MLHYNVWFNLKSGVPEESGLSVVREYLSALADAGEANGFTLLKNLGNPPRSKLPCFHALIEFNDSESLGVAMKKQDERGIHTGKHGKIVEMVCDFHVEIFTGIPTPD